MGGYLSNPVDQWPNVFGDSQLFKAYPYALPGIACGAYCGLTIILCVVYLREVNDLVFGPVGGRPEFTVPSLTPALRLDQTSVTLQHQ
jgi:hypothetical protein